MKAYNNTKSQQIGLSRKEQGFFVLLSLVFLIFEFFGWQDPFWLQWSKLSFFSSYSEHEILFFAQVFTTCSMWLFFILIPFCYLSWTQLCALPDLGVLKFTERKNLRTYFYLIILMLPVIAFVTSDPGFYQFYPIYKPATWSELLKYEIIYLLQFVAIEFFFRGAPLYFIEKRAPGMGIYFMIIPYSFIHIHKPFPEALGSIAAGLVLGHLSLKIRSIWPGVLVHMCIALSADLFSLAFSGQLMKL